MKPETIHIDDIEYIRKDAVEQKAFVAEDMDLGDMVGSAYFFRTVTYHVVGRVVGFIDATRIAILADAAWVADSGRFTQAIKDGKLNEVEPIGSCFVNLDTVTDCYPWNHSLPLVHK